MPLVIYYKRSDLPPKQGMSRIRGNMIKQCTLKNIARAVGVGLHSGQRVELTLRPAPPDTGIVFHRADLPESQDIPINAHAICDTRLASTISANGDLNGPKVHTIEHLMSACAGLGIDNLHIDITAEEIPILDGSAASFVLLLQSAGILQQNVARRFIRVKKTVEVKDRDSKDEKYARLKPHNGFKLKFQIDFDHPAVDATEQKVEFDFDGGSYVQDIARARTFGFTSDVEYMRSRGLALGGGMDNAIVMDDYRVLNADGLRYGDEFVKHKILDAIGDLYVVGYPLLASYDAYRSGHALNNQLLRALVAQQGSFEIVTFEDSTKAPSAYVKKQPSWAF